MDRNKLITLPKPLLYLILSQMKPQDLSKICATDTYLSKICQSEEFWVFKRRETFKKKPDFRRMFYVEQLEQLKRNLKTYREKAEDEIYSLIKSASISGSNDRIYRQYARMLVGKLTNTQFDTFEDFSQFSSSIRISPSQLGVIPRVAQIRQPAQIGQPAPNQRVILLFPEIMENIDPNAEFFKKNESCVEDYGDDFYSPVLLDNIYDIVSKYNSILVRINDDLDELEDQLHNYE